MLMRNFLLLSRTKSWWKFIMNMRWKLKWTINYGWVMNKGVKCWMIFLFSFGWNNAKIYFAGILEFICGIDGLVWRVAYKWYSIFSSKLMLYETFIPKNCMKIFLTSGGGVKIHILQLCLTHTSKYSKAKKNFNPKIKSWLLLVNKKSINLQRRPKPSE